MTESTQTALQLMATRSREGSRPRERTDSARLAVVLEGGSSRAAYGGGMVSALEAADLLHTVDAVYGSSAGALNGAWFVCERARANIHGWWDPESMSATIRPRNALQGKPIVDTDFIVYELYERLTPMGYAEILASDVEYHPVATDTATGRAVDLAPTLRTKADIQNAMRATARLPLLGGRPVSIGDSTYIDGGVSENTPVRLALADGATHVLALRTKAPASEEAADKKLELALVTRWLTRHAPGAVEAWRNRNRMKFELEQLMASDPRVQQIAPGPDVEHIGVLGRSPERQKAAVDTGRRIMEEALESVGLRAGDAVSASPQTQQ